MTSKVVGQPSVASYNLGQIVDQKYVKDATSQLQNSYVNFHKFHSSE
jgi:hypothetical protein